MPLRHSTQQRHGSVAPFPFEKSSIAIIRAAVRIFFSFFFAPRQEFFFVRQLDTFRLANFSHFAIFRFSDFAFPRRPPMPRDGAMTFGDLLGRLDWLDIVCGN
jgi:hypothetical protein